MVTRASLCLGRLWRIRRPLLFARGGLSGRVRWLFGWSEAPWLFLLWMEFHYSHDYSSRGYTIPDVWRVVELKELGRDR